eukprot:s1425_g5.t2
MEVLPGISAGVQGILDPEFVPVRAGLDIGHSCLALHRQGGSSHSVMASSVPIPSASKQNRPRSSVATPRARGGHSQTRLLLGPGLAGLPVTLLSPRLRSLSPRDTIGLRRSGVNLEASLSPRGRRLSPSGSVRSLVSSRAGSQNRFIPPDEEERLVIKGEQERVRAEARERREQLREAQKLQAEEEHLLRLQRRALDREAQKQRLEAERFEKWREKLEHRDMARAKLWEKSPKLAEPARSPRNSLVSVSPSPSGRSQSPRSQLQVPFSPGLSPSSSFAALVSPRQRLRSWDMNIATYTREEVHTLEKERRAELADKEVRVLRDREARSQTRSRQEVSFEKLHVRRTAELEEIRVAREAKKQQEIQKRRRDREQKQEVRAMHRAGEVGTKEYEERLKEVQAHRQREKKVYEKQQSEEEAERRRVLQAGEKEFQIQEARYRQERVRELQRQKLILEQGIKEREAEAVRDARESAKEELRRRRILDLEQKRAKVLAVKADQEERKKRREEGLDIARLQHVD